MLFVEIAVNQGFANPNDNPLIGPSGCTLQRMQARFTSAIVNHRQVFVEFPTVPSDVGACAQKGL